MFEIAHAIKLYREINTIFNKAGYTLTVGYGTLLGTVREGKRIAWDKDSGIDALVLLKGSTPEKVRKELKHLTSLVKAFRKYRVEKARDRIYIYSKNAKLDLQYAWYTKEGLGLSFGYYGERTQGKEKYEQYRTACLEGFDVLIMGNAKDVLKQIYVDWETPNPDFKHSRELRKRDKAFFIKR